MKLIFQLVIAFVVGILAVVGAHTLHLRWKHGDLNCPQPMARLSTAAKTAVAAFQQQVPTPAPASSGPATAKPSVADDVKSSPTTGRADSKRDQTLEALRQAELILSDGQTVN